MSGISSTLILAEVLNKANITEDDVDYYLNLFAPSDETDQAATDSAAPRFCGSTLKNIRESIRVVHGCFSVIVCILGSVANVFNIAVLGQKELKRAPINQILCSLAVTDLLLMVEYIPFACHMYLSPRSPSEEFFSYAWAAFVLFHAHFTQVAHTISIWLTLTLAFWRFDALRKGRQRGGRRRHKRKCHRAILTAFVGSVILCVPSFVTFGIQEEVIHDPQGHTIVVHMVNLNRIARKNNALLHKLHLWAYSVVMKLVPCLVLTYLTCWLVRRLWEAERHHQRVQNTSLPPLITSPLNPHSSDAEDQVHHQVSITQRLEMRQIIQKTSVSVEIVITEPTPVRTGRVVSSVPTVHELGSTDCLDRTSRDAGQTTRALQAARVLNASHSARRNRQTDRTTRMLVAVLILFLITEVPQGILALLSVLLESEFFVSCYMGLGEMLDMLALLNASTNFVLYCSMSRQFRTHFRRLMNSFQRYLLTHSHSIETPSPRPNLRRCSTSNPTKCSQL